MHTNTSIFRVPAEMVLLADTNEMNRQHVWVGALRPKIGVLSTATVRACQLELKEKMSQSSSKCYHFSCFSINKHFGAGGNTINAYA
jgi:hypothetical protein